MTETRARWLDWLQRLAHPVLTAAAAGELRAALPGTADRPDRDPFAPSEAICRLLVGLAPWLEATDHGDAAERALRQRYRAAAVAAIDHGTTPGHPDELPFAQPGQPLVEAAFLAHALLRAPSLVAQLGPEREARLAERLMAARVTCPPANNWLLFAAMIEAWLASTGRPFDPMRIAYAVRQHEQWYVGDGLYSDGPRFHMDYYNSFVIHPMLSDVLRAVRPVDARWASSMEPAEARFVRYAALLERLIAPDGTFPVTGRSIAYRCGAFQALAQAALAHRLPEGVRPAQVREALTAVIARCLDAPGTFDEQGWLTIGLAGSQPALAEGYISRGSGYLCTAALLPLGLPADDPFWRDPPRPWTSRRIWGGEDLPADKSIP